MEPARAAERHKDSLIKGNAAVTQRSARVRTALAVVTASAVLAGCGDDPGNAREASEPVANSESTEPAEPAITSLTCSSNQRAMGIFDHFSDGGGDESPEAAVESFAAGDAIVVDVRHPDGPTVWILRPDRTAHTQLGLRHFEDGTWIVETQDSCGDRVGPPRSR